MAGQNIQDGISMIQTAESRIRDADIAQEMMNFVKASILMQASQYVMRLHMQQAQSLLDLLNPRPPKRW